MSPRDKHDEIMQGYGEAPPWLLSSALNRPKGKPQSVGQQSLLHNYWVVTDAHITKGRPAKYTFDFSVPVLPGKIPLSDYIDDLIISKVIVAETMFGRGILPGKGPKAALSLLTNYTAFVRWRLDEGLVCNEDITPRVLERYFDRYAREGQFGLISLEPRIEQYLGRVADGLPIPGKIVNGIINVEMMQVHAELGLASKYLPPDASAMLRGGLLSINPNLEFNRKFLRAGKKVPYRDAEKPPQLTAGSAGQAFKGLEALWTLSQCKAISDPLNFDPFRKSSRTKRAQAAGRTDGQTAIIEPSSWLALLDHGAKWVLDLVGPVRAIVDAARSAALSVYKNYGGMTPTQDGMRSEFRENVQVAINKYWPNNPNLPAIIPYWSWPSTLPRDGDNRLTLNDLHYYLICACCLMIGGFSARRRGELLALQAGSTERDAEGHWWLSTYILKTLRDYDQIPVPPSLVRAINILEELSEKARSDADQSWISLIYRPSVFSTDTHQDGRRTQPYFHFEPRNLIKDFASMCNLEIALSRDDLSLANHQLRKTFSVFFYYGDRHSNLDALSRFLRHFDPEMTRRYLSEVVPRLIAQIRERRDAAIKLAERTRQPADEEAARGLREAHLRLIDRNKDFTEVKEGAIVERLIDMDAGNEHPIGYGAATLYRDLEEIVEAVAVDVRIQSPLANDTSDLAGAYFLKACKVYATTKNLEPVPGSFAQCGFSPLKGDDVAQCACIIRKYGKAYKVGSADRPDYAYSSISTCLACIYGVAFSENQRVIEDRINVAVAAVDAPQHPAYREAAAAKVDRAKTVIRQARVAAERGVA
ncbi:hypothetical protein [Sphingobium yanoikuyae]|uniref:hypothetical protein n=1 Tax=Sphingobium yanoikuyae TaxID=13690 RepID=UPI0002E1F8BD|nr:hypothetical protein [Sphingobium yanoikuyae]